MNKAFDRSLFELDIVSLSAGIVSSLRMENQDSMTTYTKEQALQKLKRYCTYQDRCHKEVRSKLLSIRIYGEWLEEIISELIREDFLNEERFAKSFVRGKFRMKGWGRNKIIRELKARDISEYCIRKGLNEIEEEDYFSALRKQLGRYALEKKGKFEGFALKKKMYDHGLRRGFEGTIISEVIRDLENRGLHDAHSI